MIGRISDGMGVCADERGVGPDSVGGNFPLSYIFNQMSILLINFSPVYILSPMCYQ
jgi:hypothetical protein